LRAVGAMLLAAALASAATPACAAPDAAEAVWLHGSIVTGTRLTGVDPERVQALAIAHGRIIATGTDAQIQRLRGPKTRLVDLQGAFVMPGFNDAHLHLADAGRQKLQTDLTGVRSLADMLARVAAAARASRGGGWILGGGWDHTLWDAKQLPSRQDLDRVTQGHPALLDRIDGHIAVANSAALAAAGLDRATADPLGGKLDRDTGGELTGILRETARRAVAARIPPLTHAERRQALELSIADAIAHGLTSAQDYSSWDDFLIYEDMEREGRLALRISEWLTFNEPLPTLIRERAAHSADDAQLRTSMLKGFMDGSLGSRTAALEAPYSDDPSNRGIPRYDPATLNAMTVERARAGFQIGFHAIGDRGVSMALDAFAAAEAALPARAPADFRFRIEHDQVIAPQDLPRQAALQVIASMQPNHLLSDMRWARERLGAERARYSYAWKSMLDHHIALAFGTDYPVEPVTPFRGLYAAVTRAAEPGGADAVAGGVYFAEERVTIAQALSAYTQGAAYAERMEEHKGRLVAGQLADFVVLDRDPLSARAQQLLETRVLRTVVGGRTVYSCRCR
jgi:predicted amidohydrolase YtcJ